MVNGIWELPFGRGRRLLVDGWRAKLAGGWQISGIATFMAGAPVNFNTNNHRDLAVATGVPAHLRLGPYYDEQLRRWVWFNEAAFDVRPTGARRSVPANLSDVRRHGVKTVDVRMARNFAVSERVRLQFIAEAFNVQNRVQFGAPETNVNSVNFGTTASQANLPRQLQFALKITF